MPTNGEPDPLAFLGLKTQEAVTVFADLIGVSEVDVVCRAVRDLLRAEVTIRLASAQNDWHFPNEELLKLNIIVRAVISDE